MSGMAGALAEAVGMGLLHFAWIGLLIGAVLVLVLSALRGRTPQLRYAVALAGFVVLACVPVATIFHSIAVADLRAADHVSPGESWTLVSVGLLDNAAISSPERRLLTAGALGSSPVGVSRISAVPMLRQWADWARASSREAAPWIAVGWLVGVTGLGLRLLSGMHYARGLGRRGTSPLDLRWQARLDELTSSARMRRTVRVFQSTVASVPLVVGWFRPIILMPATLFTGLPAKQVELLLAHELAHIKRIDPLVNLFQVVVETLLFFHPVVWWLSRRIREERELCCDDFAVDLCGGRTDYAQALLQLAESTLRSPALALSARGGTLRRRITRVLGVPVTRERMSASGSIGVAMIALCGALVTGIAWAEFHGSQRENAPAQPVIPTDAGTLHSGHSALYPNSENDFVVEEAEKSSPFLDTTSSTPSGATTREGERSWTAAEPLYPYSGDIGTLRVDELNPMPALQLLGLMARAKLDASTSPENLQTVPISSLTDVGQDAIKSGEEPQAHSIAATEGGLAAREEVAPQVLESATLSAAPTPEVTPLLLNGLVYDSAIESSPVNPLAITEIERKLAEKINLELVDLPLIELLEHLGKQFKIDFRLMVREDPDRQPRIERFKCEDRSISDVLDTLLPSVGFEHRVSNNYVLVAAKEELKRDFAPELETVEETSPNPVRVTDEITREHIYSVLDRWAQRYDQPFYLDPFVVGSVDGPDGKPFVTDGMVGPVSFDSVDFLGALRALLEPLGLSFTRGGQDLLPGIYVSTPEVVREIETEPIRQYQVEYRIIEVPSSMARVAINAPRPESIVLLEGEAQPFYAGDGGAWDDINESLALALDAEGQDLSSSELLSAPRVQLVDHRTWWSGTLFKVLLKNTFPPQATSSKKVQGGGHLNDAVVPLSPNPARCNFGRVAFDKRIWASVMGSIAPNSDPEANLPLDDGLQPMGEAVLHKFGTALLCNVTQKYTYDGTAPAIAPRNAKRSARRTESFTPAKPRPVSRYFQGNLAVVSVGQAGDAISVDFFSQYRAQSESQLPWRLFRCNFEISEGNVMGFVSPTETEGISMVTLVRVTASGGLNSEARY